MPDKLLEKTLYRDATIFVYKAANGKKFYRLQAGISSHRYASITNAKKAIDAYIKRHNLKLRSKK